MLNLISFWLFFFMVIYIFTRNIKTEKKKSDEKKQVEGKTGVKALKRKELKKFFGDKLSDEEKEKIYDTFQRRCFKCGSREKLSIDHHLPLARGYPLKDREAGPNGVVLCERCNRNKGELLPQEYYEKEELKKLENIGINSHLHYSPDRIRDIEERLLSWKVKFLEESVKKRERVRFIYLDQEDILFVRESIEVLPLGVYSRKKFLYRGWNWQWFLRCEGESREYFNIRWIYHLEKSCRDEMQPLQESEEISLNKT